MNETTLTAEITVQLTINTYQHYGLVPRSVAHYHSEAEVAQHLRDYLKNMVDTNGDWGESIEIMDTPRQIVDWPIHCSFAGLHDGTVTTYKDDNVTFNICGGHMKNFIVKKYERHE